MAPLILASASPRRLALLRQIGIEPSDVIATNIDETPHKTERPRHHAVRLAAEKLAAIPPQHQAFILAADTVVAVGRRILPKTDSPAEAQKILNLLSGRRHTVHTAIAIRAPNGTQRIRLIASTVGFARLSPTQIATYIATGEWVGKAGAYAIQGHAAAFIDFLAGSYSAVVGLPLHETATLLNGLGYRF